MPQFGGNFDKGMIPGQTRRIQWNKRTRNADGKAGGEKEGIKMERKQLIREVDKILKTYCEGCFLKSHFRKTRGKKYAHQFCIRQCTVGEQLKKYGDRLS
ncbi:hypothetical protein B4098_0005 [Heyndrickxia coagulans]|jgi:hypothetical protein|uniref:Zinc-finger domain-containing protein n=3 Tax=Heyndrickxia coagulans TaxID=1398 RepID=A0A150JVG4_HEYCO|nr:conserved hypothetical protein [Heyndrickxia coagulans 2-6]KYC59631.1 hypothetical protein B4098_0005 [Heyndrickxia coagulans]KYC61295.1 hypothetical protein B4099_3591 [Heyndrickxia coagulans]